MICEAIQDIATPAIAFGAEPDHALQLIATKLQQRLMLQEINEDNISPQVTCLIDLLKEYSTGPRRTDFHAICFVERRQHVKLLSSIVDRVKSLEGFVKPGWLVGHGGRGRDEDLPAVGMAANEQEKVVADFRSGKINLLFATNVAEEGLDFRACNCVIRFDPLQTIIGYIQSRGRARDVKSDYIVLCESNSISRDLYLAYIRQEPQLKSLYGGRPNEEVEEPELSEDLEPYIVQSTGALLSHTSAIPLLSEFCSLIPRDEYSINMMPMYETIPYGINFITRLTLPIIPALSKRSFISIAMATKKASIQNAAHLACIALHQAGAINDNLLPVRESRGVGAVDADQNVLDRSATEQFIQTDFVNFYGDIMMEGSPVVLNVLEIVEEEMEGIVYVGLIGGKAIQLTDAVKLFDSQPDRSFTVRVDQSINLGWSEEDRAEKVNRLMEFNKKCFVTAIHRKADRCRYYSLWAPLTNQFDIDWQLIDTSFSPVTSDSQLGATSTISVACDRLVCHLYSSPRIRNDVTSISTSSAIESTSSASATTVSNHSSYTIHCKVKLGYDGVSESIPQAIIEMDSIETHVSNHLRQISATVTKPSFTPKVWHSLLYFFRSEN
jgi:endoribonuclease Dicer